MPYQLYGRTEIEAAVRSAIAETGAQGPRELGKLMGRLSGELRGKADMNEVARWRRNYWPASPRARERPGRHQTID